MILIVTKWNIFELKRERSFSYCIGFNRISFYAINLSRVFCVSSWHLTPWKHTIAEWTVAHCCFLHEIFHLNEKSTRFLLFILSFSMRTITFYSQLVKSTPAHAKNRPENNSKKVEQRWDQQTKNAQRFIPIFHYGMTRGLSINPKQRSVVGYVSVCVCNHMHWVSWTRYAWTPPQMWM